MSKISVVIPCYGSEQALASVVERTVQALAGRSFEVILVNDCSPDNVMDVIRRLATGDARIIGLDLARNFGQHAAVFAGLHRATGDIVVCLDDDGQTPPEAIPLLVKAVEGEGADVAYARYGTKRHSRFRNFGSAVNGWMARVLIGKPKELFLSSFFSMKRYVVDELLRYQNPYVYLPGLVLRATSRVCNVDVEHHEREAGRSGYTMKKLLGLWFNGFTAFSVKPLRVANLLGVGLSMVGFVYLIYILVMKLISPNRLLGWSSLMAMLLIIGGCVMLLLGMIGEYLGRTYISLNRAPQFVVRDQVGGAVSETGGDPGEGERQP